MGYVDFFSHLRESHGEAYCRKFYANMTADSYKQGHLLIRSGDESDYFYIILKGAAMVLYPRRKVDIE
jgi:CRP-like cAMP-binding protein